MEGPGPVASTHRVELKIGTLEIKTVMQEKYSN